MITIDDGYRSTYEVALPALVEHGMTATLFPVPGADSRSPEPFPSLNERPMMTWAQLAEAHAAGLEVGAHTLTHPWLPNLGVDRVEREVVDSKRRLEDRLGAAVTVFAYPGGRYDATVRAIVAEHFDGACSDRLALTALHHDRHSLPRIDAHYLRHPCFFEGLASSRFRWYVRARSVPRNLRRAMSRKR